MDSTSCVSCQKAKAPLQCGLCQGALCKTCAQFLEEGAFSFRGQLPPELSHGTYCPACFHATVEPELRRYAESMEQARNVRVYLKNQGKETRLMKRAEKPVKVSDCSDREEVLLRLAFLAAEKGFNGLIDVEILGEKVRVGGYQTTSWHGNGVPIQLR